MGEEAAAASLPAQVSVALGDVAGAIREGLMRGAQCGPPLEGPPLPSTRRRVAPASTAAAPSCSTDACLEDRGPGVTRVGVQGVPW